MKASLFSLLFVKTAIALAFSSLVTGIVLITDMHFLME
jgi:hypothetical protein